MEAPTDGTAGEGCWPVPSAGTDTATSGDPEPHGGFGDRAQRRTGLAKDRRPGTAPFPSSSPLLAEEIRPGLVGELVSGEGGAALVSTLRPLGSSHVVLEVPPARRPKFLSLVTGALGEADSWDSGTGSVELHPWWWWGVGK